MSTPHQYDPEKCRAFLVGPDYAVIAGERLAIIEDAARAVIAAGRPQAHEAWTIQGPDCCCPQCAAWDGLKKLLEETK